MTDYYFIILLTITIIILYFLIRNQVVLSVSLMFIDKDISGYRLLPDYMGMVFLSPFKWSWDECKTYEW